MSSRPVRRPLGAVLATGLCLIGPSALAACNGGSVRPPEAPRTSATAGSGAAGGEVPIGQQVTDASPSAAPVGTTVLRTPQTEYEVVVHRPGPTIDGVTGLRAPSGAVLVAADVNDVKDLALDRGHRASWRVAAGGRTFPVRATSVGPDTVVMSVPGDGSDAFLEVEYDGVTQRVSLSNAERAKTPAAEAAYLVNREGMANCPEPVKPKKSGDQVKGCSVEVQRTFYVAGKGWSGPGRMWVRVLPKERTIVATASESCTSLWRFDGSITSVGVDRSAVTTGVTIPSENPDRLNVLVSAPLSDATSAPVTFTASGRKTKDVSESECKEAVPPPTTTSSFAVSVPMSEPMR